MHLHQCHTSIYHEFGSKPQLQRDPLGLESK